MNSLGALQSTLADLVAIDSTSSRPNAAIIEYLESRLKSLGFDCRRIAYLDESGVEKVNLIGVIGGRPSSR